MPAPTPDPRSILASMAAGRGWLERHAADLLPDALVFAHIGLRAAGVPVPERLQRPHSGTVSATLIPLSPAFGVVAAHAADLYFASSGASPFARETGQGTARGESTKRTATRVRPLDRETINAALADAVQGRLSPSALRWMHRRPAAGFELTHQLLAWLFCVWRGRGDDAVDRARRLARRVFCDAQRVGGYHDLLAQQTAMLALGGWPTASLTPFIRRVLRRQDPDDGGWHYFERKLTAASETLVRVSDGRSAMLGWPIPCAEHRFGALVNAMHHAHRGHATALSLCALGVFTARRPRDSAP